MQGSLSNAPGKRWSGVVVLQVDAEVANLACKPSGPQQRLKAPPFAPEEPNERFNMWF